MLHVFHVDGGRTLHLDVALVTGPVSGLQTALAEVSAVETGNQVLLVSGGTVLEPPKPLSSYPGAGTESNPIYLTSRVVSLEPGALPFHTDEAAEVAAQLKDLLAQVENISGPASLESVKRCSGIAKASAANAERALEVCKTYVEQQHLLHQGWNTLVANLEDVVRSCERRMRKLAVTLDKFLAKKEAATELVAAFEKDVELLNRVPLPAALLSDGVRSQLWPSAAAAEKERPTTLLAWINQADSSHSLEDLVKEARAHLDQMSRLELSGLQGQWEQAKASSSQEDMIAIKGISKRLGQLDEYLRKAETALAEQRKWAEAVASLESKALSELDPKLLTDIRQAQVEHLKGLLGQQSQLVEIAAKFRDSKAELLDNVRRRIGTWIQETHLSLHELATRQIRHSAKLGNLRRRLELLRQLHEAGPLFASCVAEVLRRRSFSDEFMSWASSLAAKASDLRAAETDLRAAFARKLQRHFLRSLFPALAGDPESVPEFATVAPPPFDQGLPPLQPDDLRLLRDSTAPAFNQYLQVSRASVYEKLSVDNPNQAGNALRREPSFLGTPPKMVYSARSFPSSTWLSGEENLEVSPPSRGLVTAQSPIRMTPPRRLEFAALGSSLPKSPPSLPGTSSAPKRTQSHSPTARDESATEKEDDEDRRTSAPIRIPSRPPSINTSRHTDVVTPAFGTPDQDFAPASSEDVGSLPEMISKAELIGSLAKDIGKMELDSPGRVGLSVSTPSPAPKRVSEEEDPLAGTTGLLLTASTGTAQTQTSTELVDPEVVLEKDEKIEQLAKEEKELSRRIQELQNAAMSQSNLFGQKRGVLDSELRGVRSLLEEMRSEIDQLRSAGTSATAAAQASLKTAAAALDTHLARANILATESAIRAATGPLETRIKEAEVAEEAAKTNLAAVQKEAEEARAALETRDLDIAMLKAANKDQEEASNVKLEETKAEITKQMIIESELAMDQVRKSLEAEVSEKEAELCRLHSQLASTEEELARERREKETLILTAVEKTGEGRSPVGSPTMESRLRHDLEGEYRDKLAMLIRGEENKRATALERAEAEKRAELRLLAQEKDNELAAKEATILALQAQLSQANLTSTENVFQQSVLSYAIPPPEPPMPTASTEPGPTGSTLDPAVAMGMSMSESVMTLSTASPDAELPAASPDPTADEEASGFRNREVQTRGSQKSDVLVRVCGEVAEGDVVFVVWSETLAAFILLTSGSTPYFVKESSVRRLELAEAEGPRSALAKVRSKPDYCQIRKADNRYSLPLNTRFYRVDLDKCPLPTRSERALRGDQGKGTVRYFCRHQGHGFITPQAGGDDIFVHISDIEGEFVPHEGDSVSYRIITIPPKFNKCQVLYLTITPQAGGDDIFVHISDIEGEFVPHEGDSVSYRIITIPPKFNKCQAVHVRILNFAEGVHERWSDPVRPKHDEHSHPTPNTPEARASHDGLSHLDD